MHSPTIIAETNHWSAGDPQSSATAPQSMMAVSFSLTFTFSAVTDPEQP